MRTAVGPAHAGPTLAKREKEMWVPILLALVALGVALAGLRYAAESRWGPGGETGRLT